MSVDMSLPVAAPADARVLFLRGALGLNGGIADVGSLYDCLKAIHDGVADESILDVYSDVRIKKWKTIVDPQSQSTIRFIFSHPEDVPNSPLFKLAEALKNNPLEARKAAPVTD